MYSQHNHLFVKETLQGRHRRHKDYLIITTDMLSDTVNQLVHYLINNFSKLYRTLFVWTLWQSTLQKLLLKIQKKLFITIIVNINCPKRDNSRNKNYNYVPKSKHCNNAWWVPCSFRNLSKNICMGLSFSIFIKEIPVKMIS